MSALTRLLNVFRQRSLDKDFEDELRFHLEQRIERNITLGMTRNNAEAEARARFGSVDQVKAGMRDARVVRWPGAFVRAHPRAASALLGAVAGATLFVFLVPGLHVGLSPTIYELTDGVSAPVPLDVRAPEYTTAAKRAKVQGVIRVQCVVRPDGACSDATIVHSLDQTFGLDEQALHAVRSWRFRPAFLGATPVSTRIVMEFTFALR